MKNPVEFFRRGFLWRYVEQPACGSILEVVLSGYANSIVRLNKKSVPWDRGLYSVELDRCDSQEPSANVDSREHPSGYWPRREDKQTLCHFGNSNRIVPGNNFAVSAPEF